MTNAEWIKAVQHSIDSLSADVATINGNIDFINEQIKAAQAAGTMEDIDTLKQVKAAEQRRRRGYIAEIRKLEKNIA